MGDDDKNKEIELPEKVENPDDLKQFVENTNKLFNETKEEVKELKEENVKLKDEVKAQGSELEIIKKGYWKDTDKEKALDYQFGQWWARWRKGFGKGNKIENIMRMKLDTLVPVIKADLGTPLTGDASGTDAQYLVPQTMYEEGILRTLMATSEVIPRLRRRTMTGRLHRFPVEGTQVDFTYVTNEVTDKTEKNPTWTNVDLECETYAFWVGVTDELMEDTFADIGAQLRVQAVEKLQDLIETQILNGSGSPATGVLQNTSVNISTMDSIAFEDISVENLADLIEDLTTTKKRRGASFVMHPTIWDKVRREQDANGRYFWDPATVGPRSILGYPVLLCDSVPALADSAAATAFVVFGNLDYLLWGVRMGLEFKYFDQTMYAVQDDENFWRCRTRQAFNVGIPANFAVLKTKA